MGLQVEGLSQMKLLLEKLGGVTKKADAEMKRIAYEVRETAQHMAPIDYGDLQQAIKVKWEGVQGDYRGRFVGGRYVIYIDSNYPVADPDKQKYGVETVGEYAWEVHEHMSSSFRPNPDFQPSEHSQAVAASYGCEAGGQFLNRAMWRATLTVSQRIGRVVMKSL